MKKCWIWMLCALLLCSGQPALANSWGLTGDLLDLVSDTKQWNDYTTLCNQADDAAVMHSRYHNVLMIAGDGGLQTYTKAVYQPEESKQKPVLTRNETGLSLRYGDNLWFSFREEESGFVLHSAQADGLSIRPNTDGYGYLCTDEYGTTAILSAEILLDHFNIRLFPRTINEVRHLNLMRASLRSGEACLGTAHPLKNIGKDTVPVYSAPFGKSAWRAAKGKAAVSLKGELWQLRGWRNPDGGEYWCIRYDVSPRTQRIGWIEREHIDGKNAAEWPESSLLSAQVEVIQETWLTDDPDVSQYAQFTLPVGAQLTCMGTYDMNYAYVSAEVHNGKLADGGEIVWGFVPLRDVQMSGHSGSRPEKTVMELMAGEWWFEAGGLGIADELTLGADGRYEGSSGEEYACSGSWKVLAYNAASGLYWNDPAYEIIFCGDDGTAHVYGLSFEGDTFSLTDWEGGGGYRRVVDAAQPEGNG